MSSLFDTHCHLADISSQLPLPQFEHLLEDHAHLFLSVATHHNDWKSTLELAEQYSNVYAAIGIHPLFIKPNQTDALENLESLLKSNHVSAIGEIGLDYVKISHEQRQDQLEVFIQQIHFAQHYKLPVSLHCRKAFNPMLKLIKEYHLTGVMHGFSGGAEMGKQFVDAGLFLGVNSVVLNANARRYQEMVKAVGIEGLLLETDAPNAKGVACNQQLAMINPVAKKVAELLNLELDKVLELSYRNAVNLFVKDDK